MCAFNFRHVQSACFAAHHHTAGERELRQALESAFIDRSCAVGYSTAAFKEFADVRMRFEALELLVGRQVRVTVVKTNYKTNGNLIVV